MYHYFLFISWMDDSIKQCGYFHQFLDQYRSDNHVLHHIFELFDMCNSSDGCFRKSVSNQLSINGHIVYANVCPNWWRFWKQCGWLSLTGSLHEDFLYLGSCSNQCVFQLFHFFFKFWRYSPLETGMFVFCVYSLYRYRIRISDSHIKSLDQKDQRQTIRKNLIQRTKHYLHKFVLL